MVRRETLKERIYQEVRNALQAGKFAPGEAITVKLLEQELGVGAMPVRESLQRLVAEGALIALPTGRVRVPRFTPNEFDEITEIRLRLEGLAAQRAARMRDRVELARIIETHGRLNGLLAGDGAWSEIIDANYAFHFAVYRASHAQHLLAMIDSLWLRVSPLLATPFKMPRATRLNYVAVQEPLHTNLLVAIRDQNPTLSEAAIREIIISSAAWHNRNYDFADETE